MRRRSCRDVDQMWANVYTGTLQSNAELLEQSRNLGNDHYAGIALAMEAYTMMASTDVWGDIVYSDAFKFAENGGVYQPTFDNQEAVYNAIFANLDEARTLLGAASPGGSAPGGEDQIYGGDAAKWITFCNVLEARGRLHLVKRDGDAYNKVLAALDKGGFADATEEASVQFGTAPTENGPWYQYIEQRDDCETGATYIATLEDLNDPRIATYGWPHDNSHPIWTKDQTLRLLAYSEQEFMRAEAALMTGDTETAYDAYLEAIRASFDEALVPDDYDDYIAQSQIGVGADNLTLEDIMTQKWIALYTDPEVFNDWRRTGMPSLTPVTGTDIPRRLPYAQTEIFSNPDNVPSPAEVTIFSRVWWDAE